MILTENKLRSLVRRFLIREDLQALKTAFPGIENNQDFNTQDLDIYFDKN